MPAALPLLPAIGAVLALFVAQTLLPATLRYFQTAAGLTGRLGASLGSRDTQPADTPYSARAARALANMEEALPVFLTLALLHLYAHTGQVASSSWATLFLVARAAYVPAYLSAVRGLRTVMWTFAVVGLAGLAWTVPW